MLSDSIKVNYNVIEADEARLSLVFGKYNVESSLKGHRGVC